MITGHWNDKVEVVIKYSNDEQCSLGRKNRNIIVSNSACKYGH